MPGNQLGSARASPPSSRFATDQNARRRQIRSADQDFEACQCWKPDRERIVVEKTAQSADSPGSHARRKLDDDQLEISLGLGREHFHERGVAADLDPGAIALAHEVRAKPAFVL